MLKDPCCPLTAPGEQTCSHPLAIDDCQVARSELMRPAV